MKTRQVLITLLLLGVGSMSWAQIAREVHWIHGLGGDGGSWETTAQLFQGERLINTPVRGEYTTNQGVGVMADQIRNASLNVAGPNLIGIAHSMGGVASREIDVNNNGHFGAIVTYGSPLRGARIVNAVANGEAQAYITNGIEKLRTGPFSVASEIPLINGVSITDVLGRGIVTLIANSLSLRNQTIPDLSEESGYNQGFYGAGTPTPKLMMWGEEDSPVHVRLAASFAQFRVPVPNPFNWTNVLFTLNFGETQVVDLWNGVRYYYGFWEDFYRVLGYNPLGFYARWQANQWQQGHEYLFSQSEGQWRAMIGASFTQTSTYTVWAPYWGTTEEQLMYCADNNLFGSDCPYLYEMTHTFQDFFNTPTDGVVPVRSQIAENTAWRPNDPNLIRRLEGDNHQSMRSSNAGRNELRAAFEGNFGNAFRIDLR